MSERLRKKRALDLLKWHLHGATRKGPNLILFLPSKNFHPRYVILKKDGQRKRRHSKYSSGRLYWSVSSLSSSFSPSQFPWTCWSYCPWKQDLDSKLIATFCWPLKRWLTHEMLLLVSYRIFWGEYSNHQVSTAVKQFKFCISVLWLH